MSQPNTEYSNTQGSIILPPGAIVPYAAYYTSQSFETADAPSGFLFCNGGFSTNSSNQGTNITSTDGLYLWATTSYDANTNTYINDQSVTNIYTNLYNIIKTTYGEVIVTIGDVNTGVKYYRCFRTPNLMNQNNYYTQSQIPKSGFAAQDYVESGTPFYTTIGGLDNGVVNVTNTVTLTTDNMPAHSHLVNGLINAGTGSGGATVLEATGNTTVATSSAGKGDAFPLPITPSFVMPYLIKL